MEPRRWRGHNGLGMIIVMTSLLSGSVFIHGFMTRVLGVTMVCMVDPDFEKNGTNTSSSADLGYKGTFKWTSVQQAAVIAVHNWARLVFLPVSGFIIKFGDPPQIFAMATLLCAVVTSLFPAAAKSGWMEAATVRFVLGACHAFSSPCLDQIVASGTPKSIRSTVYAVITSGSQLAVILGSPLGAFFCSRSEFLGGWPAIFYTAAFLAGLWILSWEALRGYIWVKNRPYRRANDDSNGSPADDSDNSRKSMLSREEEDGRTRAVTLKMMARDFWQNVVTEKAVWALFPCNIAATWTISLLIYYIPQFYRDAFQVSLVENGYFSALPFVVLMVTKLCFSASADWLKRVTPLSPNFIAKSYNTVGMMGSGLFILLSTAIPRLSPAAAIALLCVGSGLYSANTPGFRVSLVSINREWTGCISACCTIVAMVAGAVFPFMIGLIVRDRLVEQWNIVFALMAVADFISALVFIRWGSIEGKEDRDEPPARQSEHPPKNE